MILFFADLLVPGETINTGSAAEREWGSYRVPSPPPPHVGADCGDHTRELMPGNMWEGPDIRIVPPPAMPVAPAQARRFHLNYYAVPWDDRVRNICDPRRGAKRVIETSAFASFDRAKTQPSLFESTITGLPLKGGAKTRSQRSQVASTSFRALPLYQAYKMRHF